MFGEREQIKVSGLSELEDALSELPDKLAKGAIRKASRAGAKLFQDAMKSKLTSKAYGSALTGKRPTLLRGIRISIKAFRGGTLVTKIWPAKAVAYLARWIEYGTKPHVIKARKGGKHAGALFLGGRGVRAFLTQVSHPGQPARPFIRPAFDSQKKRVIDVFVAELRDQIAKIRPGWKPATEYVTGPGSFTLDMQRPSDFGERDYGQE